MFLLTFVLYFGTVTGQNYLFESFDGVTFPPTGWTQTQVADIGLWARVTEGANPECLPHSGAGMLMYECYDFSTGTSAALVSPLLDLTGATGLNFQFWMYRDLGYEENLDFVEVFINTSPSLAGAQSLGVINRPTIAQPVVASEGWYKFDFSIPGSFNGSSNYIIIQATSDWGNNIFVDDVRVYAPAVANNAPINFSVSSVSQNGMTILWEDNSTNEAGFRVYSSTDNVNFTQLGTDIPSTTTGTTGTVYSRVISGLLPGTTYYYRVAAFLDGESGYLTGSEATLPADQIISVANGNWNSTSTWSTSTIPSSIDNVIISEGHTVTLNSVGSFNNLTINGTFQLQSFALTGTNVTVASTGNMAVTNGTGAILAVTGNILNNGTLNFYTSGTVFGRISFSGTNPQTFTSAGTTNIGNITVNKGSSYNNTIEIITNELFTVKSGLTAGFLTLTNGTLKISGNATVTNNVFTSANYVIEPSAGIWLNNQNFTVSSQNGSVVNDGLFRITAGNYNIGTIATNVLSGSTGAVFTIEGGVISVSGRFQTVDAISFNMSGGTINTSTNYNAENGLASFGLTSSGNTINISGGEIVLVQRNTNPTNPIDFNLAGATINITGGTLRVGSSSTVENSSFRIRGTTPSIVVDNSTFTKSALTVAATTVLGNITINTGSTLNALTNNIQVIGNTNQPGHIVNNGLITNTSATGTNRLSLIGANGSQTISGTGTIGNSTTPFAGIIVSNPSGVIVESAIVTNRVNLLNGAVSGANNITMGNGVGSTPVVQRGGTPTAVVGSFDTTPTISEGSAYSVTYSTGLNSYNIGFELPASILGTLEMATPYNITLDAPKSVGKLTFAASNTGKIITSDENLLTISGHLSSDINLITGNTGYIQGPLARTFPASLASGSTYLFPIGKSGLNSLELVNPTTTSGGTAIVKANVFDVSSGGTNGPDIQDGSLGNRYWSAEVILGPVNFTNTRVRLTQSNPTLVPGNAIARSSTLTGEYNSVSTLQPVSNTITSDIIFELGFFAIGLQEQTLGGIVTGGTTICYGETSDILTLSGYIGSIIRWESSVAPFTNWIVIANTEQTYTSAALTETTRFRAVVKSGQYSEEASEYTEVVVVPLTVAGDVTGGATICEGETSGTLTLANHVGSVLRWEKSVEPFETWSTIEHTESTYTSGPLTETTRFRAVVQSGVCSIEESAYTTVTVNPIPNPTISTDDNLAYCAEDEISVTFSIDIVGDSYQWLHNGQEILNATSNTYTANAIGFYSVEVTLNGCMGVSQQIQIIEKPTPLPFISTQDEINICGDEEVSVLFSIDIVGDSYQWLLDGSPITDAISNSYLATEVGTYSVEVTVDGCIGLSNSLTVAVNPIPAPTIFTSDDLVYCQDADFSVEFTIDISGDSYQWLLNGNAIADANGSTFTANAPGKYSVEVTTNYCSGISNEIEIVTIPKPLPIISTSDEVNYCGDELISVVFTSNIADADSYKWFLNGNEIVDENTSSLTTTSVGIYSLEVEVNGCTGISNEIEVTLNPIPNPSINTNDKLVWNDDENIDVTFTVDIADANEYQWLLDEQIIEGANSISYNATAAGVYAVMVTVSGCSGTSNSLEIVENPTGVDPNDLKSISTYPNPFSNYIFISDPSNVERVIIMNTLGQKVLDAKPNGEKNINTQSFKAGIYIVQIIEFNGKVSISKMIKE